MRVGQVQPGIALLRRSPGKQKWLSIAELTTSRMPQTAGVPIKAAVSKAKFILWRCGADAQIGL